MKAVQDEKIKEQSEISFSKLLDYLEKIEEGSEQNFDQFEKDVTRVF